MISYLNVATSAGVLDMKLKNTTRKKIPKNKPKLLQSERQFPSFAIQPSASVPLTQEQLKKYWKIQHLHYNIRTFIKTTKGKDRV